MRLRELGLGVGRLPTGERNAMADVPEVLVGHADIEVEGLYTGLSVVVPYAAQAQTRALFVGRYALDGGEAMTGLAVAEDFGTFSSPIVLAPAAALGRIYNAGIAYGLARDPGLSTGAGWPPLVVGVDDSLLNPPPQVHRLVGEQYLDQALEAAGRTRREGNAGIGRGLCAFGLKGGVGTASRRVRPGEGKTFVLGALVAANAGEPGALCVDRYPIGAYLPSRAPGAARPRTFAAVLATDAPLIPRQLERLAGRAALGLSRVGLVDASTREGLVLAFSTTGLGREGRGPLERVDMVGEQRLPLLFAAGAEACEEAVLNALLAAEPAAHLQTLPLDQWPQKVRRYRREGRP